ncbi:unnamed protein product, partial [Medioppia subpectinata]
MSFDAKPMDNKMSAEEVLIDCGADEEEDSGEGMAAYGNPTQAMAAAEDRPVVDVITIDDDDDDIDYEDNESESDDVIIIGESDSDSDVADDDNNRTINLSDQLSVNSLPLNGVSAAAVVSATEAVVTDVLSEDQKESTNDIKVEVKTAPKSPKRVNTTPVQLGSTSNGATNGAADTEADPIPTKMQRIIGPADTEITNLVAPPQPPSAPVDPETQFNHYLQAFKTRMNDMNADQKETDDILCRMNEMYDKLRQNKSFLKSSQYSKLLEMFTEEVLQMVEKDRIVSHNNDLLIEMKRLTEKRVKKSGLKGTAKVKCVDKLTDKLKAVQKEIFRAENSELDFEALGGKSCWTDLPKLYRKAEELWVKREELLNRSTNTGRQLFKKLKYESTPYPEINRCVENVFNSYLKRMRTMRSVTSGRRYLDESFTIIDVRKAVLAEIESKHLIVTNSESMMAKIYEDLLLEMRNRRQKDGDEGIETYESYDDLRPETFVADDPLIDIECSKTKVLCERKMQ